MPVEPANSIPDIRAIEIQKRSFAEDGVPDLTGGNRGGDLEKEIETLRAEVRALSVTVNALKAKGG